MLIKQISITDKNEIARLLTKCSNGIKSFRYFDKRPLEIIQNHKVTIIGYDNNNHPVAYGHLDSEDEKVWLGVLVADDMRGKGMGNQILDFLISFAIENKINRICLSVDNNNSIAIDLYKKKGFVETKRNDIFAIYELRI
jgi:GNAT superfamily N-acetyltransferase